MIFKRKILIASVGVVVLLLPVLWWLLRFPPSIGKGQCKEALYNIDLALSAVVTAPGHISYPSTLSELGREGYIGLSPFFFVPHTHKLPPDAVLTNLDRWSEYIYVSNLPRDVPGEVAVLICPPVNHRGAGGHVLFANHRVEWFPAIEVRKLISNPWAKCPAPYCYRTNWPIVVSEGLARRMAGSEH
jgi:hypothetical protein